MHLVPRSAGRHRTRNEENFFIALHQLQPLSLSLSPLSPPPLLLRASSLWFAPLPQKAVTLDEYFVQNV